MTTFLWLEIFGSLMARSSKSIATGMADANKNGLPICSMPVGYGRAAMEIYVFSKG
jgi:hypothetical protein